MIHATQHCQRPWWKRPPVWLIAIVAALLLAVVVIKQADKRPVTPYGVFLDQVEAGTIASITFQGTEIIGRFKHSLDSSPLSGTAQGDLFHSRVPDFGDPALIPLLRKQHVAIDVASPSAWGWLLGRVPWPMLILVGAMLIAGVVRLMRGGKAPSGSAATALPTHGIIGLVSGLFAKQRPSGIRHTRYKDKPKSR